MREFAHWRAQAGDEGGEWGQRWKSGEPEAEEGRGGRRSDVLSTAADLPVAARNLFSTSLLESHMLAVGLYADGRALRSLAAAPPKTSKSK